MKRKFTALLTLCMLLLWAVPVKADVIAEPGLGGAGVALIVLLVVVVVALTIILIRKLGKRNK